MAEELCEEDFPGRLLHQAALWGNAELLEDLLHGDELLHLNVVDHLGRTALHAAATNENETCVRILLQAGADPKLACDSKGLNKTTLHVAAESGHLNIVNLLLEYEADLLAKDSSGLTALDLAEKTGHPEVMSALRKAADELEEKRQQLYTALWESCAKGETSRSKQILKQLGQEVELVVNTAPYGCNTLLFKACEDGQKDIVKLLLDHGADGRIHSVTKYSPLHISCYYGRKDISEILLKKFTELVNVLTVEHWLPIHAATINGHLNVLDMLLKFPYPEEVLQMFVDKTGTWGYCLPFDINAKDVTDQTVLYISCSVGNHRLVELLLKFRVRGKKLNPESQDGEQKITSPKRKLSESLQFIMTKLNLRTEKEVTGGDVMITPLDLDIYCKNSETCLHVAVKNKHYNIASLLLQNGASPNLKIVLSEQDEEGSSTALVEACRNRDTAMVDLLVRYGARDDDCKALAVATKQGDERLLSKLLSLKAHQDPEHKINKNAFSYLDASSQIGSVLTGSVTYSTMFPTCPVMINWHGQNCLVRLKEQWLVDASLSHNIKLKLGPKNHNIALAAITRLDISNNELIEIPGCIFQMPSLKILNAAQNKIEKLPPFEVIPVTSPGKGKQATKPPQGSWVGAVLEEMHLQDNRLENVPACLFQLPALVLLDLSNNKLQTLPVQIWTAPKLRELNLSLNMLQDLPSFPQMDHPLKPLARDSLSVEDLLSSSVDSSPAHSLQGESNPSLTSPNVMLEESIIEGPLSPNLHRQQIHHHNVWSKSIDVVDSLPEDNWEGGHQQCHLIALNLAHNAYQQIPPVLACCALGLARLNMSYNQLGGMGPLQNFPSNLKHLDLSHNQIFTWPTLYDYPVEACCNSSDNDRTRQGTGYKAGSKPRSVSSLNNSTPLHGYCIHRRHRRLDNLRTLILADNKLDRLIFSLEEEEEDDDRSQDSQDANREAASPVCRSRVLFSNLSMLDISNNCIRDVPLSVCELGNLSVLNLSGNISISSLPPEMGLLSKLWNLNTRGCRLNEPLKSMMDSKKYKTMDIIGYLKSILEDAKPYARMKLMIVGVQGIGKTSLLEQLRQEGTGTYRKKPAEHWAKRMGNKNINLKTPKGVSMSTVGVDVGDWTYEKKIRGQSSYGAVTFRTWDFGGQKEYYATHQYFLSKRSLYLVVWRITDGEKGVNNIQQWLVNIQARAPNAPVIIVGTHYDMIKEKYPPAYSEDLQQLIRERFINIVDADKCGLPRVLDTIELSCRTRHNIKLLCNLIYDTVFGLCCPGSKERLLEQKIPATYLALEDVVGFMSLERQLQGKDPVLRAEQYKMLVMHEMQQRFSIAFRDMAELNQATTFLHENGVLLHYEDATLKDLYFLDPQWLCDMLAHVVTIREINPFARNGIMKTEDLKHVFKSSQRVPSDAQTYILNLLNKFEVALTWDTRTLLIPSLLPTEEHLRAGLPGCDVRIPVRSRSWALRKTYASSKATSGPTTSSGSSLDMPQERRVLPPLTPDCISNPILSEPIDKPSEKFTPFWFSHQMQMEQCILRLLFMSYFPSGFWSRLMTRILADDTIVEIVRSYFNFPRELQMDPALASTLNKRAEWICWQTGMELRYMDTTLFRMKEVLPHMTNAPCDYHNVRFLLQQEGNWIDVDIGNSAILEILLPNQNVNIQKGSPDNLSSGGCPKTPPVAVLQPSQESVAKLLSLAVDHIDTLLEDWYPTLGTRFVHTSEGKFLVTRVVPCSQCLLAHCKGQETWGFMTPHEAGGNEDMWQLVDVLRGIGDSCVVRGLPSLSPPAPGRGISPTRGSQGSTTSHDSGVGPDSTGSSRKPSAEGRSELLASGEVQGSVGTPAEENVMYCFMVEECILTAYEQRSLKCPLHNEQPLVDIAPDTVFVDLGERHLVRSDTIKRGKMLGRGAFGFVFKATVKQRGIPNMIDVAMKMLQPVDPGFGARQSDTVAYKAAWSKWQRDPLQYACKAYCTARQELNILLALKHQNIVPLVGICIRPLALILRLAPMGALDTVLRNYRRSGARLNIFVLQKIVVQIAKALEYLHQQHIIYRDLKSENVLVWEFPAPFQASQSVSNVDVKLADYGISRSTLPTGTKGFGGTEGFMAPEIMRFNGEEEYTEKVDCFSFGMFMYELVTLRLPFEGQECVKDHILEGGRPSVTNREMVYPTYVLDLMTLCWAQQPKDRPSASQIVSIATAPEFVHLVDVVSLHENTTVLSAAVLALKYDEEDENTNGPLWETWLSRLGKQLDIMACSTSSWQDYKTLRVDFVAVTSLCVVEESVWLGDSRGVLHIYSGSVPYKELTSFTVDPEGSPQTAVRNLCSLPSLRLVAITTSSGRLWLCSVELALLLQGANDVLGEAEEAQEEEEQGEEKLIRELGGNGNPVFCITPVQIGDPKESSMQLWCGQSQGSLSLFHLQGPLVTGQEVLYHYEPLVDNLDVTQLVSSSSQPSTVWSYIYPGCVVYQWDVKSRQILHKLDCSKLAPCSESLMSISIEEHLSPGRCQVTALAVQGTELYIGTTWGCLIIAEGNSMRPITVFRPYEEEVKAILPLPSASTDQTPLLATVGKGYRNLIGRYTVMPCSDQSPFCSMYLMLWTAQCWTTS